MNAGPASTAGGPRTPRPPRRPAGAFHALADGTPYVGEIGVLAVDESRDRAQCHLCGRWLRSLGGSHLRAHGWTAEQYREAFGLTRHRSLDCPGRNAGRAAVQRRRMVHDPEIRAAIARGVDRARSGELTRAARAADADPARRTYDRAERRRIQRRHAERGGATVASRSRAAREDTVRRLGFPDVTTYLTVRTGRDRASVHAMAAELGVAAETVVTLLSEHGIARAEVHDEQETLARVGFDRFADYLACRHQAGCTVAEMARELGHSAEWVRVRARRDGLAALIRPAPTALQRARQAAAAAGFATVEAYVRHRYEVDGLTARQLRAEFGLHPQQVARLLDAGGVTRRHDPQAATGRALAAVDFADLTAYATDRHSRGYTVERMAAELGRSHPWLTTRLRQAGLVHLIGPPGRATHDPDEIARRLGFAGLAPFAIQRAAAGATVQDMARELGHSDTWLARHLRAANLGHLIGRPGNRYGRRGRPAAPPANTGPG